MRSRRAGALVAVTLTAVLVAGGCADDGDAARGPGGTPAPTDVDPGPNDTSQGPVTIQGVVRLDPAADCVALEADGARSALTFDGYSLTDVDGRAALVADDDGRVLAHDGDQLVVSGRDRDAAATECGEPFTVESLNSVLPAATADAG